MWEGRASYETGKRSAACNSTAAYHNGVRRANASARQHGYHEVEDHWLVDGDRIALFYAEAFEHVSEALHAVQKAGVRDLAILTDAVALPGRRG